MSRKWKWGVLFSGDNLTLQETIDFAAKAEDAGAESLWTTELGRDAFVPLAGMAAACTRARLGTGVAIFARPPALTEISAMSMAELTEGRFVLGLGTAPPAWNENWHGLPYRRPVQRMREYVEAIRLMWTANPESPIDYEGEIITIRDYRRVLAPPCEPPPIYLAAVQPAMLQLTGEMADGLLANLLNTPRYFTDIVHPTSTRASARRGGLARISSSARSRSAPWIGTAPGHAAARGGRSRSIPACPISTRCSTRRASRARSSPFAMPGHARTSPP